MRRFIRVLALFLLPVFLVCAFFFAAILRSGELLDTRAAAQRIANGEDLFIGLAYRDDTRSIKQFVAAQKKARLLVLGTSRSMQFRGGFFETDSFYNAGGAVAFAPDLLPFLKSLPKEALPENLLIVLDQYFYNEQWGSEDMWPGERDYLFTDPVPADYLWRAMQNYASGKFSLRSALFPPKDVYGLAAAGRGSDFYSDGSYSYGRQAQDPSTGSDAGFSDTYLRISLGTNRFEYGQSVCAFDVEATRDLLEFCQNNDVQVTAILPPYAPSVWQRMKESGQYSYIQQILPALGPLFAQYGAEIFDYTYLPETEDAQYIDGFHGSDRVYAAVCLRLSQDSDLLSSYLEPEKLNALFTAPGAPCLTPLTEND